MTLTPTAARMLSTLPSYYLGEPLYERILQARANEIDRADALIDQLASEMIPGTATDALGLLGAWERQLNLTSAVGLTEDQRRARVCAALQGLDSITSAATLATIQTMLGEGVPFTISRDTPWPLYDLLEIDYDPAGIQIGDVQAFVERLWPAHRQLVMRFADGWIVGVSRPGDGI
jgi:Uncharacterised protein conserved in bacteria (DUF2313)